MTHLPGRHLLLDLYGITHWLDAAHTETLLRAAAAAGGATVLSIHLHDFGQGHGLTGVAILAESHISLHGWPELDYIALDIFMCGDSRPEAAADVLAKGFGAARREVRVIGRGGGSGGRFGLNSSYPHSMIL